LISFDEDGLIKFGMILPLYLGWHFVKVPSFILKIWRNFILFFLHFFSIGYLVRTLFSPWHRLQTGLGRGFSFNKLFEVLSYNLVSRGVGFCVRLFLIGCGFFFLSLTAIFGAIIFILWWPAVLLDLPLFLLWLGYQKDRAAEMIKKSKGDIVALFLRMIESKEGKFVFLRLGISESEVKNLASSFEADFDKTLMLAKQSCRIHHHERILISDLFWSTAQTIETWANFLFQRKLASEDVRRVARWHERLEDKRRSERRFWELEGLLRVPAIGRDLTFGYTPEVDKYTFDLSRPQIAYKNLIPRQRIISSIIQTLSRSGENNCLLVGEPGVGKYATCQALAQMISSGQVAGMLKFKRVLDLNMAALFADSPDPNLAKGKLLAILDEAVDAGNVILVIRNIDLYLSSGKERTDFSDVFAGVIGSSKIQIIGMTTPDNFARYIYPNADIMKLFEKVEVEPISKDDALRLLIISCLDFEKRTGVLVLFQSLKELVEKADRYITEVPFPEKAIDLLDEVTVYVSQKLKEKVVLPEHVDGLISIKAEIPLGEIEKTEVEKLKNLEKFLHQRIIDQEEAITAVSRAMRRSRVRVAEAKKPLGTFLFLGPTGVGKTETAKALSELYFGSEEKMIRLDMADFHDEEAVMALVGSSKTGEPGILIKEARDNPFCTFLLDELEKASRAVQHLFLTVIDEGYLSDAFGKKVSFKNMIIIGTSNAAAEFIREQIKAGKKDKPLQDGVLEYVQREGHFSPEFLNRFDAVVVYRPLESEHLTQIAKLFYERLGESMKEKGVELSVSDEALKKTVADGYKPEFGARPMSRVIADGVEDLLAKKILSGELKRGDKVEVIVNGGGNFSLSLKTGT
jgi:ATP-dependent Clp protease ATP-binding subunit ClpC